MYGLVFRGSKISDLARNAQEKAKQEAEGPENSGQKTSKLM